MTTALETETARLARFEEIADLARDARGNRSPVDRRLIAEQRALVDRLFRENAERLQRWCPVHGPLLYGTRCLTCEREREAVIVNPHVLEHVPEPVPEFLRPRPPCEYYRPFERCGAPGEQLQRTDGLGQCWTVVRCAAHRDY